MWDRERSLFLLEARQQREFPLYTFLVTFEYAFELEVGEIIISWAEQGVLFFSRETKMDFSNCKGLATFWVFGV